MKGKEKKTAGSGRKKAEGQNRQLSDKKKNIRIRKEALKKIFDHFNDPDKKKEL
jgi:hypothetical protein